MGNDAVQKQACRPISHAKAVTFVAKTRQQVSLHCCFLHELYCTVQVDVEAAFRSGQHGSIYCIVQLAAAHAVASGGQHSAHDCIQSDVQHADEGDRETCWATWGSMIVCRLHARYDDKCHMQ